jgi:hypothetical protein
LAALSKTPVGAEVLRRGGAQLRGALPAGEVRTVAAAIPDPSARAALLHAYHIGFSTSLNHLMTIGGIVALVGAVASFALVRQRDFIVPGAGGHGEAPQGGPSTNGSAPAPSDVGIPAAHA